MTRTLNRRRFLQTAGASGIVAAVSSVEGLNYPAHAISSSKRDRVLQAARSKVPGRIPYHLGASFDDVARNRRADCSVLTQWIYAQAGLSLHRTSLGQWQQAGLINRDEPGGLVFFKTFNSANPVTHVGINMGGGVMVNANSHANDVIEETFANSAYWRRCFVGYRSWPDDAPPPPPPPPPSGSRVTLQAPSGHFVCADHGRGGLLTADRTNPGSWETFQLSDLDGGNLDSGNRVHLRCARDLFVCAEMGGGSIVVSNRQNAGIWETLTIISKSGNVIRHGDEVYVQTYNGTHYFCAEHGGGSELNATRTNPSTWETFRIRFV